MTVKLCLSCSLGLLNRRPRAHSAGCWLSLLHLISIFSGPQLIRAQRPLQPDVAFPTTFRLQLSGTLLATALARRTQLNYIIVRCPLDLWNRMFNRHQAEITVMQFRGHSLPLHQSMSVPREFFLLVPFYQPISAQAISSHNCHQNVSPPSGASPWMAFLAGSKGQNTTVGQTELFNHDMASGLWEEKLWI